MNSQVKKTIFFFLGIVLLNLTACPHPSQIPQKNPIAPAIELKESGWNTAVKARLEQIIAQGANQGNAVVFDFDNTLVCRDIGEATFGQLVANGVLSKQKLPKYLSLSFALDENSYTPDEAVDLAQYYDQLTRITQHQQGDIAPDITTFMWLVQIMAGMTPKDIIDGTKEAYAEGIAIEDLHEMEASQIEITSGKTGYKRPFFLPRDGRVIVLAT